MATATQIILATLPLYSQNATWRSSTANTDHWCSCIITDVLTKHEIRNKNISFVLVNYKLIVISSTTNGKISVHQNWNPTTYAYQCFDSNHFHILIVFKPICFRGHTYFICFSLLSILVFNTISISDDIYVVKRNMTGAPEFTADFEWGWCCSTFRFLWRIAGRVM